MNKEAYPLVTVCIPTFNRSDYLRDCIKSVIAQDYPCVEIVVSDNASTDDTAQVLAGFGSLKVNRNTDNVGQIANWNVALSHATGEYVLMLSDDDLLEVDAISQLAKPLINRRDIEFSYSPVTIIDSLGSRRGATGSGPREESCDSFIKASLRLARSPFSSALLFRRSSAIEIGGFVAIKNGTDVAFRLALASRNLGMRIWCCSVPVVLYRVHENALSANPVLLNESCALLQEWLIGAFKKIPSISRAAMFQLYLARARNDRDGDPDSANIFHAAVVRADKMHGQWLYSTWLKRRWRSASANRKALAWLVMAFPILSLREAIIIFRKKQLAR